MSPALSATASSATATAATTTAAATAESVASAPDRVGKAWPSVTGTIAGRSTAHRPHSLGSGSISSWHVVLLSRPVLDRRVMIVSSSVVDTVSPTMAAPTAPTAPTATTAMAVTVAMTTAGHQQLRLRQEAAAMGFDHPLDFATDAIDDANPCV